VLNDDALNCGACGNKCSDVNNKPACTGGKCDFGCFNGWAHCSGPANTGCETSIRETANCGRCGVVCTDEQVANATGIACTGTGQCTYLACESGHWDENGDPTDGCEAACGGKNQRCCPTGPACTDGNNCNSSNHKCPPN
jgi:hypothetical protein